MLDVIRKRNLDLLKTCNDDTEQFIQLNIIKKILEDDSCFFKINIDDAFSLLNNLGYSENECYEIYMNLISAESYDKLG